MSGRRCGKGLLRCSGARSMSCRVERPCVPCLRLPLLCHCRTRHPRLECNGRRFMILCKSLCDLKTNVACNDVLSLPKCRIQIPQPMTPHLVHVIHILQFGHALLQAKELSAPRIQGQMHERLACNHVCIGGKPVRFSSLDAQDGSIPHATRSRIRSILGASFYLVVEIVDQGPVVEHKEGALRGKKQAKRPVILVAHGRHAKRVSRSRWAVHKGTEHGQRGSAQAEKRIGVCAGCMKHMLRNDGNALSKTGCGDGHL